MKKEIIELTVNNHTELTVNIIEIHSMVFEKLNGFKPTVIICPFDIYCDFVCGLRTQNFYMFKDGEIKPSSNFISIKINELELKIFPVHQYKNIEFH